MCGYIGKFARLGTAFHNEHRKKPPESRWECPPSTQSNADRVSENFKWNWFSGKPLSKTDRQKQRLLGQVEGLRASTNPPPLQKLQRKQLALIDTGCDLRRYFKWISAHDGVPLFKTGNENPHRLWLPCGQIPAPYFPTDLSQTFSFVLFRMLRKNA